MQVYLTHRYLTHGIEQAEVQRASRNRVRLADGTLVRQHDWHLRHSDARQRAYAIQLRVTSNRSPAVDCEEVEAMPLLDCAGRETVVGVGRPWPELSADSIAQGTQGMFTMVLSNGSRVTGSAYWWNIRASEAPLTQPEAERDRS